MVGPIYEQDVYQEVLSEIKLNVLEQKVIHVGHDNNVKKYYSIANVFVHSPFFEGGMPPLVILEAIASNLPVITVDTLIPSDLSTNPAIRTVPPHVDLFEFDKRITDLRSSQDVEDQFAKCMVNIYNHYQKPDAGSELVNYDKSKMFQKYIELVSSNM
jgi:glycosyltransferase involved in cell wall biosynthesis